MVLDIETMPTVGDPDFEEPSHWRVLAIAVGAVSDSTDRQTTVMIRKSDSQWAEYMLIDRAVEWLQMRHAWTLCTYNGTSFDIPILRHRARETMPAHMEFDTSALFRLNRVLDTSPHRDLFRELRRRQSDDEKWPSLEEACHKYDISTFSTQYERETVAGGDIPRLGAKVLDISTDSELEEQTIRQYASEDVRPLLELAQKLDEQEVSV